MDAMVEIFPGRLACQHNVERAECRKDGAGLCRSSPHLLLTCPLVLHLTDKLRPVKEQILLTIGFIKNLPLLKKRLAVPKNDSACNVAFCPQNFFGTG
uniref:Uncharacterized protein n=1 Tax=Salix viminalis TaxID=40686 RepID=A0A6N2M2B3_SALVM